MSWEQPGFRLGSFVANADLSANQFRFVRPVSVDTVDVMSASTQIAIGVQQNKPVAGQAVDICVNGVSKVVAGAAVTVNTEIMSDTVGRAITAATTGNRVQGIALEAASGAGVLIAVLLNKAERLLP